MIKRHGIGMSRIEPADRPRAHARKHRSLFVGFDEQFVDAQTPPEAHHEKSISTADVDYIRRQDLVLEFAGRWPLPDEEQNLGFAFQEAAEIVLDALPVIFGIRTRGRNEEKLGMRFSR